MFFRSVQQTKFNLQLTSGSKVLNSLLFPPSLERSSQIYQGLVGLLCRGATAVFGLHTVKLFDLHTVDKVLECQ